MNQEENTHTRKHIVFLSSSYVNLAKMFAKEYPNYDIFLIIDRKFPFEIEDLDNFYTYTFDKSKIYDIDKERYFDNLGIYINEFDPDLIITNNYTKLIPNSFLDFLKFTRPKVKVLNIHHADLRIEEEGKMKFSGLNADIKEILDEAMIISTIHRITDQGMDTGERLAFSHETTVKELKIKSLLHKPEDMLNFRTRNIVRSYHERTKVLHLLHKVVEKELE
jgi:folate-dependent phosphoribosylglycinamide formyltransferase PurN